MNSGYWNLVPEFKVNIRYGFRLLKYGAGAHKGKGEGYKNK